MPACSKLTSTTTGVSACTTLPSMQVTGPTAPFRYQPFLTARYSVELSGLMIYRLSDPQSKGVGQQTIVAAIAPVRWRAAKVSARGAHKQPVTDAEANLVTAHEHKNHVAIQDGWDQLLARPVPGAHVYLVRTSPAGQRPTSAPYDSRRTAATHFLPS